MKKLMLLLVVAVAGIGPLVAQTGNRSLSISYGFLEKTWRVEHLKGDAAGTPKEGALLIDADLWCLNDRVTLGAYVGGGLASYVSPIDTALIHSTVSFRYGINAKCHLLNSRNRWDVSLTAMLGSMYSQGTTLQMEYGAGLSAAYYPVERLGLVAEYLWGGFKFADHETSRLFDSQQLIKMGITYLF